MHISWVFRWNRNVLHLSLTAPWHNRRVIYSQKAFSRFFFYGLATHFLRLILIWNKFLCPTLPFNNCFTHHLGLIISGTKSMWIPLFALFFHIIVYRNKWLGNTYYNFRYSANMINIGPRGFDSIQCCIAWLVKYVKFSNQISNTFAKIMNGCKSQLKTLSKIWDGAFSANRCRYWLQRRTKKKPHLGCLASFSIYFWIGFQILRYFMFHDLLLLGKT